MKVMLAQINPRIADFRGNSNLIIESINKAMQNKVDVVLFPELATCGYPPRDLLYREEVWAENDKVISAIERHISQASRGLLYNITVIVGGLHREQMSHGRVAHYNAAWIIDSHFGRRVIHKRLLPCYDVFDETRYFMAAINDPYIPIQIWNGSSSVPCDVLICEDIWNFNYMADRSAASRAWMSPGSYGVDPVSQLTGTGPLFVLNGSPFWEGKINATFVLIRDICEKINRPIFWCNQVGGHDDIVTGGYSMGAIPAFDDPPFVRHAAAFKVDSLVIDTESEKKSSGGPLAELNIWGKHVDMQDREMYYLYRAICLGVSDYAKRCGFKTVVFGSSGGIDSALVGAIATDVFGSGYVTSVGMPSPYSSGGSIDDAKQLAENLGIKFIVQRIDEVYKNVKDLFLTGGKQKFDNPIADENLQPRIRGMILMGHSNEEGSLLLATGNKSELSVGYCTIYGDMCGGYGVISDLWKTQCYELSRFINKYMGRPVIPVEIIDKEPSAELKEDQLDSDSLPPYPILDQVLNLLIEEELPVTEIYRRLPECLSWIDRIVGMVARSEHKRQVGMALGPKVKERAFGAGRRIPIAMKMTFVSGG